MTNTRRGLGGLTMAVSLVSTLGLGATSEVSPSPQPLTCEEPSLLVQQTPTEILLVGTGNRKGPPQQISLGTPIEDGPFPRLAVNRRGTAVIGRVKGMELEVLRLDSQGNLTTLPAVKDTGFTATMWDDLSPDGNRICGHQGSLGFRPIQSHKIHVLDLTTGVIETVFEGKPTWRYFTSQASWSPDGESLAYVYHDRQVHDAGASVLAISTREMEGWKQRIITPQSDDYFRSSGIPGRPMWMDATDLIVFESRYRWTGHGPEWYIVDSGGRGLEPVPLQDYLLMPHPTRAVLLFARHPQGVFQWDAATRETTMFFKGEVSGLKVSPDGSLVAYFGPAKEILVSDPGGTNPIKVWDGSRKPQRFYWLCAGTSDTLN